MHATFSLGRIAGVEIGVNWSWAIVFALIVWSLASAVFPSQNPGLLERRVPRDGRSSRRSSSSPRCSCTSSGTRSRRGARGSRSRASRSGSSAASPGFKGELPSAGAEFRIAIAGPLVTLVLGAAFVAVAALAEPARAGRRGRGLARLHQPLPARLQPDPGAAAGRRPRAARGALGGRSDDFAWATVIAADIGRGFGFLMIARRARCCSSSQGAFSGAWLAFLGWFLLGGRGRGGPLPRRPGGARGPEACATADDPRPGDGAIPTRRSASSWTTSPESPASRPIRSSADGEALGVLPLRRVLETPRSEWDERRVGECMLSAGRGSRAARRRRRPARVRRARRERSAPRARARGRTPRRVRLDHRCGPALGRAARAGWTLETASARHALRFGGRGGRPARARGSPSRRPLARSRCLDVQLHGLAARDGDAEAVEAGGRPGAREDRLERDGQEIEHDQRPRGPGSSRCPRSLTRSRPRPSRRRLPRAHTKRQTAAARRSGRPFCRRAVSAATCAAASATTVTVPSVLPSPSASRCVQTDGQGKRGAARGQAEAPVARGVSAAPLVEQDRRRQPDEPVAGEERGRREDPALGARRSGRGAGFRLRAGPTRRAALPPPAEGAVSQA